MTDILRLSLPLTVWLISFSAVYGLHGGLCAAGWDTWPGPGGLTWGRSALLAAAALAVLTQTLLLWLLATPRFGAAPGFLRQTSLSLAAVALIATLWTHAPMAALPLCGP
jgi:hypothetical protein